VRQALGSDRGPGRVRGPKRTSHPVPPVRPAPRSQRGEGSGITAYRSGRSSPGTARICRFCVPWQRQPDSLTPRAQSPGVGWVTLCLPMPSQSESDGLTSDLTHAQSLSTANTARVNVRPGYANAMQCSCQRWINRGLGIPEYRMPKLRSASGPDPTRDRHVGAGPDEYPRWAGSADIACLN